MVLPGRLLVVLLAVLALGSQEPVKEPPRSVVRYFVLQGDVDRRGLNRVLRDASTEAEEFRLLFGPVSAAPRPKEGFVAMQAPASASEKDLVRLLKKGCKDVEELVWTSFSGGASDLPPILGQSPRDCVIGMASEMRWFYQEGDRKFFFHAGTKLDAEEIGSRFHTLFEPFHAGEIGTLVVETVRQALSPPVDPARIERALKAIKKLPGVQRAAIEGEDLVLDVELASQRTSRCAVETPEDATLLPLPHFDMQPVLGILAKEGIALRGEKAGGPR